VNPDPQDWSCLNVHTWWWRNCWNGFSWREHEESAEERCRPQSEVLLEVSRTCVLWTRRSKFPAYWVILFACSVVDPVFRIWIRIHRIHMFLGLPDPDPGSTSQSYESGSFYHQAKTVRKTLIPTVLWLFLTLKLPQYPASFKIPTSLFERLMSYY
jgi:hypothetical protein